MSPTRPTLPSPGSSSSSLSLTISQGSSEQIPTVQSPASSVASSTREAKPEFKSQELKASSPSSHPLPASKPTQLDVSKLLDILPAPFPPGQEDHIDKIPWSTGNRHIVALRAEHTAEAERLEIEWFPAFYSTDDEDTDDEEIIEWLQDKETCLREEREQVIAEPERIQRIESEDRGEIFFMEASEESLPVTTPGVNADPVQVEVAEVEESEVEELAGEENLADTRSRRGPSPVIVKVREIVFDDPEDVMSMDTVSGILESVHLGGLDVPYEADNEAE